MANKLILKGTAYDTDSNGSLNKLLDNKDVVAGDGIKISLEDNEGIKIASDSEAIGSDIGIKIVDGVPCAVYVVAEEEE